MGRLLEGERREARSRIWLVDGHGLVHDGRPSLESSKAPYARAAHELAAWNAAGSVGLEEVVWRVHPTILIGTSAQPGAFTERIVREMASAVDRPIVFPLSNPTSKSEATPLDLLTWTDGRAVVATGSPFPDVRRGARTTRIGQCDNAFIFPGVGLGAVASGARKVTNRMFTAAARALAEWSPAPTETLDALYPRLEAARAVSRRVALAVALQAQCEGVAEPAPLRVLEEKIELSVISGSQDLRIFRISGFQDFRILSPEILKSSNPQILKSSNPQILKSSNPQILKSSNPEILKSG